VIANTLEEIARALQEEGMLAVTWQSANRLSSVPRAALPPVSSGP
jgi:hypothetical protein